MKKLKNHTLSFYVLFLILVGISCAEANEIGSSTLNIEEQTVDFNERENSQTIIVNTNAQDWTASVDQNSKSWCTVSTNVENGKNRLSITVTSNTGKELRTAIVTVRSKELSHKITIRQLGTDKGILISPQALTVKSEGENISFKITANVEFEITTESWITKPAGTRTAEYITTDHTYNVQRNKGEERTGSIVVKDKGSDLSAKLTIIQKAFGEYSSSESTIKAEVLVPVSTGSATNASGRISELDASVFKRAFDGSKETGYHSSTNDGYPNNWPLKLTFEFLQQDRIDYFIYHSSGNETIKKMQIFISTKERPEYTKLMDVDLSNSSAASLIKFPKPVINPNGIRMEVTETTGNYIIIKEMEFYRKNPSDYDPLTLFKDITCSELKTGITETEIDACPDPLFRNIAYYLFINQYPRDFRIQEYKAYPHPELFKQQNKTSHPHSVLDNPTGIFARKGKEVVLLVGNTYGNSIYARVLNLNTPGEDGFKYNHIYPLNEGVNRFISESDGLIYIYYHTPKYKEAQPIKIHIPTGEVNGYFDVNKHKSTDWNRLLNAAVSPFFDILGSKAHLIFPVDKFKSNTPDGKRLIDAYDRLVLLEQQFMGLEKYRRSEPNRVCFSVMYNDSYMYSSWAHTGYSIGTVGALCNYNTLTTSEIWGPAHEVGHSYQTRPGLCWHGMTEVTNNIHSLYVQTQFGNPSRLLDKQGDYSNIYEKSMTVYFTTQRAHIIKDDNVNLFNQLVPFWQLYLYTKAIGKEDFYKDLFEAVRTRRDQATPGASQLEFTVIASEIAGLDLTEFFTKWGFLEPIDAVINDYGKASVTVTTSMINDTKQRISKLGLPKPTMKIEYICDTNIDFYINNLNIIKGTAQRNNQTFTMRGWQNVVAYEVYSESKLRFVSPASTFTVIGNLGEQIEVYAVSATGSKVRVTF